MKNFSKALLAALVVLPALYGCSKPAGHPVAVTAAAPASQVAAIPKECLRVLDLSTPNPAPDLNTRPDWCKRYDAQSMKP